MVTGGCFHGSGVKLTTHLHLVFKLRMVELYFQVPYAFIA
jgi:hypothetical protein